MSKAIGPGDLAEALRKKFPSMSKREAREAVKTTFDAVQDNLAKGRKVRTDIGVFDRRTKPAQKGGQVKKNPFTGEEYKTKAKPAVVKPKFRPNKTFKNALQGK